MKSKKNLPAFLTSKGENIVHFSPESSFTNTQCLSSEFQLRDGFPSTCRTLDSTEPCSERPALLQLPGPLVCVQRGLLPPRPCLAPRTAQPPRQGPDVLHLYVHHHLHVHHQLHIPPSPSTDHPSPLIFSITWCCFRP